MKIFYDWEFLDDGHTITPISVGMVREDGHEFYAVFEGIMAPGTYMRIAGHPWLMTNVIPHLPLAHGQPFAIPRNRYAGRFQLDRNHPDVMSKILIRNRVRRFLDAAAPVQLWGYYAAYDHVLLGQLFGRAVDDRPRSMPMVTYDIVQLCHHLGRSEAGLPPPPQRAHNALEDARWARDAYDALLMRSERS